MTPETVSVIQSCFPGSQWAKATSKQHDAAHTSLGVYPDEMIVAATRNAKQVLARTFITVTELLTYCRAEKSRHRKECVAKEKNFNPHEVESDREQSLKRILNMPRDEIASLVKRAREAGVLSNDPIDPDLLKWRSWQIGMVCAVADSGS